MKVRNLLAGIFLSYLRFFTKLKLQRTNPKIVGVAGASGKSSLVNLIYIALGHTWKVKQTTGKNSETGLPLSILDINPGKYTYLDWLKVAILAPCKALVKDNTEILIVEMGIDGPDEPKNMTYLLKILTPEIGILTNLTYEHSQYFDSSVSEENEAKRREKILEMISNEEIKLLTSIPKDGFSFINLDDKIIKRKANSIKSGKITISKEDRSSDYFIEVIQKSLSSFKVIFTFKERKYELSLNFPLPDHYAYSLVYAVAVAGALGLDTRSAVKNLEQNFALPPGRLSIFKGIRESVIIDSSYNNATLTPILDILDMVREIGQDRKKIGVIGDMRELGSVKEYLHNKLAFKIVDTLDQVFLIGPLTKEYVAPILRQKNANFKAFNTYSEAKDTIIESVGKGDIVLVKGSQNTLFLERVVEDLLESREDVAKLPRRGAYWDEIRAKTS